MIRAVWLIPAALTGVSIGMAIGRRVGENQMTTAFEQALPMFTVLRKIPQQNYKVEPTETEGEYEYIPTGPIVPVAEMRRLGFPDSAIRKEHPMSPTIHTADDPHPAMLFNCQWCDVRYPLDEAHGVLIEHNTLNGLERCNGSGRFPHL